MKNIMLAVTILLATSVAKAESMPVQRDTIQVGDTADTAFQSDMHQRFRDIFNTFFNHAFNQTDPLTQDKAFMPVRSVGAISARSEMSETKDEIIITSDMPGAKKENIEVQIQPRLVSISYQVKEEASRKDDAASIREARYASYQRQYSLPDYADIDNAEAEYKDGVLTITVPRDEKKVIKPRNIKVK